MVPRSPGRQAFLKPEQDRPCPIDPSQSQRLEYSLLPAPKARPNLCKSGITLGHNPCIH